MPQSTTSVPAGFDGCPDGDPMVADGRLLETQTFSADAARISGITWASVDGCHTVTITFTTEDGAPATTPPSFVARLLRDTGVLRIETGATDSVVADQVVEHGPIDRLFVPVDDAGLRFIDLVLDRPVVARASLLSSPARVEIEIHEGGPNDMGKPLIDRRVVIVAPGPGSQSGTVLDVAGYTSGDATTLTFDVLSNQTVITSQDLEIEPAPRQWRAFAVSIQVGSSYNGLQIRDAGGTVIAGIPLNP